MQKLITKPDVIISWPDNNDYPLWRKFIKENRETFDKVIIVFTKTHSEVNYKEFVTDHTQDCTLLECPSLISGEDWRSVAVNYGLSFSSSEWVWFTEQDFYITDELFWEDVNQVIRENMSDFIGVLEGQRIHPCSMFVKRSVIDRTSKFFGIVPDKSDHFFVFTQEVRKLLPALAFVDRKYWKHYNGLSHNFSLISRGERPVYQPIEFYDYLSQCLHSDVGVSVGLSLDFVHTAMAALKNDIEQAKSS